MEAVMAIYRMLKNLQIEPEEASNLATAYELVLLALDLKDRDDPITEMIAKKVLEIGQRGIRDTQQISTIAIEQLGRIRGA
jgi:hypothetical protein